MSNKKVTYSDVWKTLRAVDTSKIQYKKQFILINIFQKILFIKLLLYIVIIKL